MYNAYLHLRKTQVAIVLQGAVKSVQNRLLYLVIYLKLRDKVYEENVEMSCTIFAAQEEHGVRDTTK